MGATIAPPPVLHLLSPQGSVPLPTGRLSLEGAAGREAQGAFPSGGTVGVTALCSETLEVHDGDGSGAAQEAYLECALAKARDLMHKSNWTQAAPVITTSPGRSGRTPGKR